ncbi:hypothetical protein DEO72_LG2g2150 [Vigna unguiculata]|uniref:Uncharacterized protein n=1 Tax=Vigna unguiculata TaxID=3917 RepID=A0A4D6KXW5_VIGUN|nr:hypothetical protein DEO72_LG2g2150 [Vigna unguiculata]
MEILLGYSRSGNLCNNKLRIEDFSNAVQQYNHAVIGIEDTQLLLLRWQKPILLSPPNHHDFNLPPHAFCITAPPRHHAASLPAASIDARDVALVLDGSTISLSKANPKRSLPRRNHPKTSAAASTTDVDVENPETLDLHSPSSQARLTLLSRQLSLTPLFISVL